MARGAVRVLCKCVCLAVGTGKYSCASRESEGGELSCTGEESLTAHSSKSVGIAERGKHDESTRSSPTQAVVRRGTFARARVFLAVVIWKFS